MIVETIYQQPEAAYLMEADHEYNQMLVEALNKYAQATEKLIFTSYLIIIMLTIFVILRIVQKKQKKQSKIST